MPTLEEMKAQMAQEGIQVQTERNRRIAQAVQTGALQRSMGRPDPGLPELTPEEAERRLTPTPEEMAQLEPREPELTGAESERRLTMSPEEELQSTYGGIVQRMAENYQTSPQYRQLLDQELAQISDQIAQLTQRRNIIEMAKRGQA